MYSLLTLTSIIYVINGNPFGLLASTCTEIPAGSTMKDHNGDTITFHEPIPASKCQVETNNEHHTHSREYTCDSTGAAENYYNATTCTGTPAGSNPITLNGQCMTGGCAGFTNYHYNNGNCQGRPEETITNEYFYWNPTGCNYNMTQSCVNGVPQFKFYNNTGM